jgi:hypothetical protein
LKTVLWSSSAAGLQDVKATDSNIREHRQPISLFIKAKVVNY